MENGRKLVREEFLSKLKSIVLASDEFEDRMEAEEKMWQFCTLFPQHYEFEKDALIQLWIAAGFLMGRHNARNFLIGDLYFSTLLSHQYIVSSRTRSPTEKDKYYKVDTRMMVDDAISTMLSSNYKLYTMLEDLGSENKASKEAQYVSLVGDGIDDTSLKRLTDFKDLKVFMLLNRYASNISKIPQDIFSALRHLEVLDFSGTNIFELPDSIENLTELKYLDLSLTLIESLPETLDCLTKLQTLKLRDCKHLYRLPEGTKSLTSLRHLELDILGQLAFMPSGIGALTKLETLSAFVVHKDDGRCIKELQRMNNLKEDFCISRLENVLDSSDAKKAALFRKKHLKQLELRWSDLHLPSSEREDQYEILQKLCPHSNLEQLHISCYSGLMFPRWVGDPSLNMLSAITLFKCDYSVILPSLGDLPSLKSLSLVEMNNVTDIGTEFRGFHHTSVAFPKLERLALVGFSKLVRWEGAEEKRDYPSLRKLTIERCPNLMEVPSSLVQLCSALEHLEIIGCRNLTSLLDIKLSASLVTLIMEDFPKATERFLKNKGRDRYSNIEHVQNVWIDQQLISKSN